MSLEPQGSLSLTLNSATSLPVSPDSLLARARIHWLFGEWQPLCQLDDARVASQEQRAAIALLISSAHQQQGEHAATRHWARKAIQWGMAPNAVARLLAAGVHNTLGRMALLREDKGSIGRHFAASMQLADLNDTGTGTLVRARAGQEVRDLEQRLPGQRLPSELESIRWPLPDDASRSPGRQDVVNGYRWILGRDPESDAAIQAHQKKSTVKELRISFLRSPEFSVEYSKRIGQEAVPATDAIPASRIVFMHLPKTGGTAVHSMLRQHFRDEEVCPERWNNLYRYSLGELTHYRLFSGHFDHTSCQLVPGANNKIFTMLREPKARLMSLYYFERAHKHNIIDEERLTLARLANELSPLEFFQHREVKNHSAIRNAAVNSLIGCIHQGRWEREEPPGMQTLRQGLPPDTEQLALAQQNLESLTAFGILEQLEASVAHIFPLIGLDVPETIGSENILLDVMQTNAGLKPVDKMAVSTELDTVLDALTELDRPLYQYACDLLRRRFSEAP